MNIIKNVIACAVTITIVVASVIMALKATTAVFALILAISASKVIAFIAAAIVFSNLVSVVVIVTYLVLSCLLVIVSQPKVRVSTF